MLTTIIVLPPRHLICAFHRNGPVSLPARPKDQRYRDLEVKHFLREAAAAARPILEPKGFFVFL
jgi:hypothetical protein